MLDEALPDALHMTLIYLMVLLTALAIVIVAIPYYAILTACLFAAFALMLVGRLTQPPRRGRTVETGNS